MGSDCHVMALDLDLDPDLDPGPGPCSRRSQLVYTFNYINMLSIYLQTAC